MELLLWNIPVILFTPFDKEGYNKETIENFKLLKKNNMFFDNYKDAAKFINSNSQTTYIFGGTVKMFKIVEKKNF